MPATKLSSIVIYYSQTDHFIVILQNIQHLATGVKIRNSESGTTVKEFVEKWHLGIASHIKNWPHIRGHSRISGSLLSPAYFHPCYKNVRIRPYLKSWIAKQLMSISTCFLFHFISNQVKRLDFIIRWFFAWSNGRKSIQTFFYEIKLRGKKKHVIMFAKYFVNYISKRETCRYGRKLFCNSPLHLCTYDFFLKISDNIVLIYIII